MSRPNSNSDGKPRSIFCGAVYLSHHKANIMRTSIEYKGKACSLIGFCFLKQKTAFSGLFGKNGCATTTPLPLPPVAAEHQPRGRRQGNDLALPPPPPPPPPAEKDAPCNVPRDDTGCWLPRTAEVGVDGESQAPGIWKAETPLEASPFALAAPAPAGQEF